MAETITMKKMEQKLQKADRKQARLYLFCNFMALMIITAYSALMLSPTVQTVFPEGGDSRRQMYAIFVLTLLGCVIFTMYASSLFFRHKSGQLGILMALGASRRRLVPGLFREVLSLSTVSSLAGIVAGFPFVWIIWSSFRLFLVDSPEMELSFDMRCLGVSVLFLVLVVGFACFTAWRYLRKTNIMEVIREEHINEPVKELGRWCGPVGAVLILAGGVIGYCAPGFWQRVFHAYAPAWTNFLYAPVFIGLYMVMLHTVVHGWRNHRKNPYRNIISRSMMKFQGKQTVNNLIIITLLIAGACFAIFYVPTASSSMLLSYARQPFDYFFHYPIDQNVDDEEEIRAFAGRYGLTIKDWTKEEYITLGMGGRTQIMEDERHFHIEYLPIAEEVNILSEESYAKITGETVDVSPGTYMCVTNADETNIFTNESAEHLTNMTTRIQLSTKFAGYLHYDLMVEEIAYYVVDSADYEKLADGLSDEWRGEVVGFNIDGKDSYEFSKDFFHHFVDSFDESCAYVSYYDRVAKIVANENGEEYFMDMYWDSRLRYEDADSSEFRLSWKYRPSFRLLGKNDYLFTMAVFFMMFIFIFIVCLLTALVVSYTRCQTIALNNRYIFDDLKKLGASPDFMTKEVRSQCNNVFKIPAIVGMAAMMVLFSLILYGNDGKIVFAEMITMGICLGILAVIGGIVYAVYRGTVKEMKRRLDI